MDAARQPDAAATPTRFVESRGRRLAYRSVGSGTPLVLCVRFRGTLDSWDPAFLDALAANGLRVITFDYTGLGLSTGTPDYNPAALATDAHDLITALGLEAVAIGGWSLGGLAAQVFFAMHARQVSHLVLIGTGPPGPLVKLAEPLFYETAAHPANDFEDEVILFFEPKSAASRAAARDSVRRIAARAADDRSPPVPIEFAAPLLAGGPRNPSFPADPVLRALEAASVPILHVGGDHDIVFPVENWYALNQRLPTLQLLTFPGAGHGPHHQHPQMAADAIASFMRNARAASAN
jgi:pimeloyl-ACP methyl ester carboxylesterase